MGRLVHLHLSSSKPAPWRSLAPMGPVWVGPRRTEGAL